MLFRVLIVDGKKEYNICLCMHGEFVCHQRSIVYSQMITE